MSTEESPSRDPVSGTLFAEETGLRPALRYIRHGEFWMGPSSAEDHAKYENGHQVKVSSFALCDTEITRAQFSAVRLGHVADTSPANDQEATLPASNLSWFDSIEYLNELSKTEGLSPCYLRQGDSVSWENECTGYRLPTEAEWEYSARAGSVSAWGIDSTSASASMWYRDNAGGAAHPVRTRAENHWKLYDMQGNVWEWVWDALDPAYGNDIAQMSVDPKGPKSGRFRVIRGGSFDSSFDRLRVWIRDFYPPDEGNRDIGFRCARSMPNGG